MTIIFGLDCATLEKKTGLARGSYDGKRLQVKAVTLGSSVSPVVDRLLHWIETETSSEDILLCIDAPLGWPAPMGKLLAGHRAGAPLAVEANQLFRRETDRFVRKMLGKLPLDVGADRIARTAHRALTILSELRTLSGLPFSLPLQSGKSSAPRAIEVYPAGTLLARGLLATGYKGTAGLARRQELIRQLQTEMELHVDPAYIISSDDAFDAVVCLLAGIDFLQGQVYPPTNPDQARQEGWIWVKIIPPS